MVGEPGRLCSPSQRLQSPEMFAIQRLCRAEIHRNTVLDDSVPLENLVEHLQSATTIHHVVLGDDLKPIHDRLLRKDVIVVRNSQTDSYAIVTKSIEAIGCHPDSVTVTTRLDSGGLEGTQAPSKKRFLSCLRRFGAIGSAATFAFAVILAGILATALPLAIILAFTGVFGLVGRGVLGNKKHASP